MDDFEAEENALLNSATSVSQTRKKSGTKDAGTKDAGKDAGAKDAGTEDAAAEERPMKISEDQRAKFDELSIRCRRSAHNPRVMNPSILNTYSKLEDALSLYDHDACTSPTYAFGVRR